MIRKTETTDEEVPSTRFLVRVDRTLKGTADGQLIVTQPGGIRDGVTYLVGGSPLLSPGHDYLFAATYYEAEGSYDLSSGAASAITISPDRLKSGLIEKTQNAITNEIPYAPTADQTQGIAELYTAVEDATAPDKIKDPLLNRAALAATRVEEDRVFRACLLLRQFKIRLKTVTSHFTSSDVDSILTAWNSAYTRIGCQHILHGAGSTRVDSADATELQRLDNPR